MKAEAELQKQRYLELARRAMSQWCAVTTRFMTQEERPLASWCAREAGAACDFDGGFEDAERVQCCFHPEDVAPAFPARWVEVRWNGRFASLDHRALLGSLMALGLDRSWFGDIVVEAERAFVRALPEAATRLPGELTRAGSATVRCTVLTDAPLLAPPAGERLRDTVASLRLDCVLASGMKTSRAKAAEWIKQGLCQVDHQETERTDILLHEGSLISIRGFGRMRVLSVSPPTRKDRLPIELEVFGKR